MGPSAIGSKLSSINLDRISQAMESLTSQLVGGQSAKVGGGTGYSTQDSFQAAAAAGPKAAGGPAAAGGDLAAQLDGIVKALTEIVGQLQALLQQMQGGGAGGGEAAQAAGSVEGGGHAGHNHGAEAAEAAAAMQNASSDPALDATIQKLAQDPEGAALLQAAQAAGLKSIKVADLPNGTQGLFQPGSKEIFIDRDLLKNPSDLVRTLAHELGHAATVANGNSQAEEAAVDRIGNRIADRIEPGKRFTLDVNSYRNLQADNGIANDLRQIGIAV